MTDARGNNLNVGDVVVEDINDTNFRGTITDVHPNGYEVFVRWINDTSGWCSSNQLTKVVLKS